MLFAARGALLLLALSWCVACSRREPPASDAPGAPVAAREPAPSSLTLAASSSPATAAATVTATAEQLLPAQELTWVWQDTPVGKMQVVVVLPKRRASARFPVLVTMHGRGEALKGPERGARGWLDDYALGRAIERLAAPPLTNSDLEGHAQPERLTRLNQLLTEQPYEGLIVVCPYTPDVLAGDEPFKKAPPLADFIVSTLLPRVYRDTPALGTAASTGIDGVSLGGRAALTTGLLHPAAFGAVATLQAAFDVKDAPEIAARARAARETHPGLQLRLLTSDQDYFLRANRAIARALSQAGVKHELLIVSGPHDYDFNRGPGAIEMLVFHDRVLRGKPAF